MYIRMCVTTEVKEVLSQKTCMHMYVYVHKYVHKATPFFSARIEQVQTG